MAKRKEKKKKTSQLTRIKKPARLNFLSYVGDLQGCGTIRIIYPYLLLNHYRDKDVQVMTTYLSNYVKDPDFYKNFTFTQFQRSATEQHFQIFLHYKSQIQSQLRAPIVYEIDDLLIGIPEWNYASIYYKKNEEWAKKIMGISDALIVSTPKLKEIYSEYNKKIGIIPNHLPKFIWGDIYPAHDYKDEKEKIKILYAGSQNHFSQPFMMERGVKGGDFSDKLINFIRKTTDKYEWIFKGGYPLEIEDLKKSGKVKFYNWSNIFEYPKELKEIEPDICIAPLEKNIFNQSKSNIKNLEYIAVGAPAVYTKIEPYLNTSLQADTDDEMISYIEKLAEDIDYRASIWEKDYDIVKNQLWWEEDNNIKKYMETYLGLFGKRL